MENFKQSINNSTKIIATIGPSTDSYDAVYKLIKNGVNGIRLNFSHASHDEHKNRIQWVRKISKELNIPIAIIQDLQGPKIRLGDFDGSINVQNNDILKFGYNTQYIKEGIIPIQYDLSQKVKKGERLYLYDGKIKTIIEGIENGIIFARAQNKGELVKRKGINLPDTDFNGDIITSKDLEDLKFGVLMEVDYIALSFVQRSDDIENLRQILKKLNSNIKIISKIETRAAVDNLEEIIKVSDAVMVARGDLAVETPPESVPIVQRRIVNLCLKYSKTSIIATQMLFSMTDSPLPTRAEVSDIATAVIIGADSVMLSDETASGNYPIESVMMMQKVCSYTKENSPLNVIFKDKKEKSLRNAISSSVITLVENINAKAIVVETKSGATALEIADLKPIVPIIAVTDDILTYNQLAIVSGVRSFLHPVDKLAATKITDYLYEKKVFSKKDLIVTVSGDTPGEIGNTDTIKVRIL